MKKLLVITNLETNQQCFFALSGANAFEVGLQIVWSFADKRQANKYQDDILFNSEGVSKFKANGYNKENVQAVLEYEARFERFVSIDADADWDESDLKLDAIKS